MLDNLDLFVIPDHPVIKVLTDRGEDRAAQDFVKKQKERLLRC